MKSDNEIAPNRNPKPIPNNFLLGLITPVKNNNSIIPNIINVANTAVTAIPGTNSSATSVIKPNKNPIDSE